MKINEERKKRLEAIYQDYLHNEKIMKMKDIPMHRGSNCYIHSFKVAKEAIKRAMWHKNVDLENILLAAIMHDYYLYNWREERRLKKRHGRNHPLIAAKRAQEDFDISEQIQRIIQSHMWPLNVKIYPNSREAKIISYSDKKIAFLEALTSKKYKKNNMNKYEEYISYLFIKEVE